MATTRAGHGLFSGAPVVVVLSPARGETVLAGAPLGAWRPRAAGRTTALERGHAGGARRVALVEHLFAAMGALGLHAGVRVELEPADATELPLLDGGARAWCEALRALEVAPSAARLSIARAGEVVVGESRYRFEPGEATRVEVELAWPDAALARAWDTSAAWAGEAADFVERIAPARTFATARDVAAMAAAGTTTHADPISAFVIDDAGEPHASGPPVTRDEPARHKLLDLIGDLFAHGGPPLGSVHAVRPGHAATHAAIAEALSRGLLRAEPTT